MKKDFYYFYNLEQANFFILHNIPVLKVGIGNKGDIFVKFPKTKQAQEVFDKWCNYCSLNK